MKENNLVYISCQEDNNNPIWLEKVEPFVHQVLTKLEKKLWDLSIVFCQDPFIKDLNYAEFLTADAKEELAKYPSLKDLTDADNISFSQVCNVCRTAVKSAVANHSGDKNTKEEL